MRAALSFLIAASLASAGCGRTADMDEETAAVEEVNPDVAICAGLTTANDSGNSSLRAAFVSTPEGQEYGGGVIKELTEAGKYRFVGAEMVGDTCYANAEARGVLWGSRAFNLVWRCPVKMVSDNPAEPGKTVLEVVEDRECDFDTERGAPKKRDVLVELIRQ